MNLFTRQKEQQNSLKCWQTEKSSTYSFLELRELTQQMLNEYTGTTLLDTGLGEELRKQKEEHRRLVSHCIRVCCAGNYGAKETVKGIIKGYLAEELQLKRSDVWQLIPFDAPERMTAWQMLETMMYCLDRGQTDRGFAILCDRFGWDCFREDRKQEGYVVTEEEVREAYAQLKPELSVEDEFNILSQLIFALTVGLGVIDSLNQQKGCIEEIQIGMNGRQERQYDYKEELRRKEKKEYFSRDGVHILVRGCTIWLRFLSFETEEELQRVLRNLIKESQAGELTRNHPMVVVDTVDGRRVSVSRPPMTDAWVGLIRKFDTVQEVSLDKLYQGCPEEELLPELIRQLVKSGRNVAITGEMASGKTTLFRACLAETRRDMNIRVVEADSFELNVRGFLPKANSMTMRITQQTPAEEVLAFARKTTGQIFAVGEINSAAVAAMAMDLSKIASQLLFSAHYVTTEHMIADFVNAKLCVGGYSEEVLAEMDVVRCLGFDIHLKTYQGRRYVQSVNEVVPVVRKEEQSGRTYLIRPIYMFDEDKNRGAVLQAPSALSYEKAKQTLGREDYEAFCNYFAEHAREEGGTA